MAQTWQTGGCPVSARLSGTVLSLPLHPYLTAGRQARVIDAVRAGGAR